MGDGENNSNAACNVDAFPCAVPKLSLSSSLVEVLRQTVKLAAGTIALIAF